MGSNPTRSATPRNQMTRRGLRRALRLSAILLGAAAAVTVIVALVIQFRIRIANDWQQYAPLPKSQLPARGDSIIVFAPHCDDETLGCGGMLSMAAASGARVRVVLITNGDGYRVAVARAFGTIKVTPAKCIQFAYQRQRETLGALAELGVSASRVIFLGYPDRGIAALWNDNWGVDRLYVSRATKSDCSPYANSYTPGARYCGESLIGDIESLIRLDKPTDVYVPHPSDNHPDHYATYCFVTAAVAQLASEGTGFASKIRIHTYLVHRGDWPVPRGNHTREPLAPPHALARGDTKWCALPLPSDTVSAKRAAIRRYKTQTDVDRGFLTSFARRNEVFGSLPVRRVASVGDGMMRVDGRSDDWQGIPPAVVDPIGDYVVAGMSRGGDVRAIYLCRDRHRLYVRADCVRRLSKRITYTVNLRAIAEPETDDRCVLSIQPPRRCTPASTVWAYRSNVLEVAVPLARFGPADTLFVQVLARLGRVTVDNTGWHEVTVTGL